MTESGTRPEPASGTNGQRRSGRIQQEIPIILMGHDAEGLVFSEETRTVVLSRHGAGIVSYHKLMAEQELILRMRETSREAEVRVIGEIGTDAAQHTYGVAFVDDTLDFWGMEFPPAPAWQAERPAVLTLECAGCREIVEVANGDFEFDICAIHGGLARFCDDCGMLTVWRRPTEVVETRRKPKAARKVVAEAPKTPAVPLGEWREPAREMKVVAVAEEVDRRKRVRAKVNFFACVRSERFGEEVVACIDMSRGGVSFRSRNAYKKDTTVEIAVPYAADVREAPAIFVRGRIAHVELQRAGETWRCGVEFLK